MTKEINPISVIQGVLLGLGFDPKGVDGVLGKGTQAALDAALSRPASPKGHNLPWIEYARSLIGQKEIKGDEHNPYILDMWEAIGADYDDDETPWCSGFVGAALEAANIKSTGSAAARSYEKWGQELGAPIYGCVVVFWRESPDSGKGHVGFVVGKDSKGNLMVLGGNQGDEVNIKPFGVDRVVGYRWPKGIEAPKGNFSGLAVLESSGKVSVNEA